jgi:hypothetical protein
MNKTLISLLMGLLLAGCTSMAPEYRRPEAPVPADWGSEAAGG